MKTLSRGRRTYGTVKFAIRVVMVALTTLGVATSAALAQAAKAHKPVAAKAKGPALSTLAWVELEPSGSSARAIVTAPNAPCPDIVVDGVSSRMDVRAGRTAEFNVLVCEKLLAPGVQAASIGGTKLPLPPKRLKRIAVIGDTGCRIKDDDGVYQVQDCNSPEKWPFATVAQTIVDAAPDVVLHVGDYHYREAPCPEDKQKECGGSPWGDNWPAWNADFFEPAAPLLAAVPWVFVRGNHEECSRAGEGWFRFLFPDRRPAVCNDDPTPQAMALPGLQLLLMNTSVAKSEDPAFYTPAFERLNCLAATSEIPESWLLMHHPLWAFRAKDKNDPPVQAVTETLQEASDNWLTRNIHLVLTGHIHIFEALGFEKKPRRAPQVVVGNAGTLLDDPIETNLVGLEIAGATVQTGVSRDKFGYSMFVPLGKPGDGWRLTSFSTKGNPKIGCTLKSYTLTCQDD